jgi:hypothetical protein
VIFVAVLVGGVAIGLLVGRWWIVLAPVGFGVWIAATTEVDEVPPWFLGLAYDVAGVAGSLVGLLVRRRAGRRTLEL